MTQQTEYTAKINALSQELTDSLEQVPIPLYVKGTARRRWDKYPWKTLKSGQSFLVTETTAHSVQWVVHQANKNYAPRHFVVRRVNGGFRIWRVDGKLAALLMKAEDERFPIENNIPIPLNGGISRNKHRYPWLKLQIGESFWVKGKTLYSSRALANYTNRRLAPRRFITRAEGDGHRFWRIEDAPSTTQAPSRVQDQEHARQAPSTAIEEEAADG